MDKAQAKAEVERLLTRSEVFGWIWLMGIGSLISLLSLIKARKIMRSEAIQSGKKQLRIFIIALTGLLISASAFAIIILFRADKRM